MATRMKSWKGAGLALLALGALLLAWPAGAVELKAGIAKGIITPADPIGRITVMGVPAKGVEHDLYARVLVLDDGAHKLVIVTYDLNCLDVATPIVRSRARHELGIEPAYLLLLATHNHAAPIQIVPANFAYGRWLADRIFGLIQEAIANERGPVKVLFGYGPGDFLRGDPRYPSIYGWRGRPIDNEVQVLKVTRGEETVALYFTQASHPLQASFHRIEVGHPGYAVEEVEARSPGALALYSDGCGGDQFIRRGFVMWAPLRAVKKAATDLADTVMRIASGPMQDVTGELAARLQVISLPLEPPISLEEAQKLVQKEKIPTDLGLAPYPEEDRPTNWVRSLLKCYQENLPFPARSDQRICTDDGFLLPELPEPREFPCRYEETIVAKIGALVFVAMQGEVCAPIGLQIKRAFRGRAPILVAAYLGEHNLYLPTRVLVEHHAYQSEVIQTQYASPVGWAPEVEDELIKAVEGMIQDML